jgi:hypothetical protein
MRGTAPAAHASATREVQDRRSSKPGFLGVVLAEFRRALAAERRYEDLRRANPSALARADLVCADIPRRIFEKFYSST